jgi:hypothetical protein
LLRKAGVPVTLLEFKDKEHVDEKGRRRAANGERVTEQRMNNWPRLTFPKKEDITNPVHVILLDVVVSTICNNTPVQHG